MKPVYKIRQKSTGLYYQGYRSDFGQNGHTWLQKDAAESAMIWKSEDLSAYELVKFELKEIDAENFEDIKDRRGARL